MNQTTTSSCTRKYAQGSQQKSATQHAQQQQKTRNNAYTNYKRVMVKLVRLLSARPAAVSLVATGLSLPNPL
jgi:hypothetical protein